MMILGDLMRRIAEANPEPPSQTDGMLIWEATRKMAALGFWMSRATPYYKREFYLRRGRPVPANV